ncbi:MAG: DinB family protein [Vicinamibacterales bacterium]
MSFHELLLSPLAYAPPAHVLEDLSDAEAVRRIEGAPHSVAEIVAHLVFWQEWFLSRARGVSAPMVGAAAGWPPAPAGSWNEMRERFLSGAREGVSLGSRAERAAQRLAPAIEFPPLSHYTVTDALTHVAIHNAHHLGQVVVLRQLLGRWPPPSGSWTW